MANHVGPNVAGDAGPFCVLLHDFPNALTRESAAADGEKEDLGFLQRMLRYPPVADVAPASAPLERGAVERNKTLPSALPFDSDNSARPINRGHRKPAHFRHP